MSGSSSRRPPLWLVIGIAAIPLLLYPLASVVGGAPRFPSRDDCVRPAVEGQPVDLVYGRFDSPYEAQKFLEERVLASGFQGTEMLPDDCGRWRVVLTGVPSIEIAEEVRAEARTVELDPHLELGSE